MIVGLADSIWVRRRCAWVRLPFVVASLMMHTRRRIGASAILALACAGLACSPAKTSLTPASTADATGAHPGPPVSGGEAPRPEAREAASPDASIAMAGPVDRGRLVDAVASAGAGSGADATAVAADAGSRLEVAGPPPPGLVPMFVAAGMGGRTITSCDDGRTWTADNTLEAGNNDHSPYAHKGFAYGNGLFIELLAWGADVSLKVSDDGVTWRRETMFDRTFYGGLGFGGGAFVMMRQGVTQSSRDGGKTWRRARVQPRADFREGGGGGSEGVFAGGSGSAIDTSWDGGETWGALVGCPAFDFGGIGQHGGIAYAAGSLVLVSRDGASCQVQSGGTKVTRGSLGSTRAIEGKLFLVGGRFWVPNGNEGFVSEDGVTWTRVAFAPRETAVHAIARSDAGTFVGVDRRGGGFFRSADGITWLKVNGSAGNQLLRVAFGYGKPSSMCPGR